VKKYIAEFKLKPIVKSSHLLHLCRYIHGNPAKDGFVADPADLN